MKIVTKVVTRFGSSKLKLARTWVFALGFVVTSTIAPFVSSSFAAQSAQISQNSTASTLTPEDEMTLIQKNDPGVLNMLGQRLIDPHHFENGVKNGMWPTGDEWIYPENLISDPDRQPYLGYGKEAFDHWKSGNEYVLKNYKKFPTVEDLQQVHSRAFYNLPADMFWGFYRYQIWANFPAEKRPPLYTLLDKGQTDPAALDQLFKLGIKNGRGVLRSNGDTAWSGLPWNTITKSSNLYTQAQFDAMAANPLLRPEIKSKTPLGIDAKFWHPAGTEVEALLSALFAKTKKKSETLRANRASLGKEYRPRVMALAAEYYQQLVIIHPMWDGVGRSSKLMRDWLLRYMGYPPPASTPEEDMELTTAQYTKVLDAGVRATERKMKKLAVTKRVRATLAEEHASEYCFDHGFQQMAQ